MEIRSPHHWKRTRFTREKEFKMKEKKAKNKKYHFTASIRAAQKALVKLIILGLEDKLPRFSSVGQHSFFDGRYEEIIAEPIIVWGTKEKRRTVIFLRKDYAGYCPFVVKLRMASDNVRVDDVKNPDKVDEAYDYEHCWKVEEVFFGRLCEPNYFGDGKQYVLEFVHFFWSEIEEATNRRAIKKLKNRKTKDCKTLLSEFIR